MRGYSTNKENMTDGEIKLILNI